MKKSRSGRGSPSYFILASLVLLVGCDGSLGGSTVTIQVQDFSDAESGKVKIHTYSGSTVEDALAKIKLPKNPAPSKEDPLKSVLFTKYQVSCKKPEFQRSTWGAIPLMRDSESSDWKIDPEFAKTSWPELPHKK